MRNLIIIITSLLLSWSALAVDHVKPGDTVKKEGFVFDVQEEQKVRANNERRKLLEKLVIRLDDKIDLQDYQIDLYKEHVDSTRPLTKWQKVGYFFLGMAATSASLYVSSKILENRD